jgi:SAM-dependent methyltransferase
MDRPMFNSQRPKDLRLARPWHRFAYLIRRLPQLIGWLAPVLEVPAHGRVLDYGCAELPYRYLFDPSVEYVGADLPGNPDASLELRANGSVPVADATFDAVVSTQVLEHVGDPGLYLSECYRVLRPGGRLLLTTHGVFFYHPDPVDYWRWTSAGLQRIVEQAGFEVITLEGIVGLMATGIHLVNDAVYSTMPPPVRTPISLVLQFLMRVVDRVFDSNEGRRQNALVFGLVARKP